MSIFRPDKHPGFYPVSSIFVFFAVIALLVFEIYRTQISTELPVMLDVIFPYYEIDGKVESKVPIRKPGDVVKVCKQYRKLRSCNSEFALYFYCPSTESHSTFTKTLNQRFGIDSPVGLGPLQCFDNVIPAETPVDKLPIGGTRQCEWQAIFKSQCSGNTIIDHMNFVPVDVINDKKIPNSSNS